MDRRTGLIVGAGRMGLRHLTAMKNAGLAIAGIVDANPEMVTKAVAEHGFAPSVGFTDYASALAVTKPTVVVIATTAPSHHDLVIAAARAGVKFILCEKPMAASLSQCDSMISECEKYGARLAINHQMRYMEQYTIPKSMLESEQFGGLGSVSVSAGNFGLAMNGSHYFEMFRFITGEAPARVAAWFSDEVVPNPRGPQFEDRAGSVRVETASGKRLYLDCGTDQGHGVRVIYTARNGQIDVDELIGRMIKSVRHAEHRAMPTTRYGMPWLDEDMKIVPADVIAPTQAVLEALIKGNNYPTGADGRLALEVLAAAYWSNDNDHATVAIGDPRISRDRIFPWA